MKEKLQLAGQTYDLEKASSSEEHSHGEWAFEKRPGGWWLATRWRADGTHERKRIYWREERGSFWAKLNGRSFSGSIMTPSRSEEGGAEDEAKFKAEFPGNVRKVLVREGDQVAKGQDLILIEAMKMEFPVKTPYDGKVKQLFVGDGANLSPGDQLIEVDPQRESEA